METTTNHHRLKFVELSSMIPPSLLIGVLEISHSWLLPLIKVGYYLFLAVIPHLFMMNVTFQDGVRVVDHEANSSTQVLSLRADVSCSVVRWSEKEVCFCNQVKFIDNTSPKLC